jgi:integrase
MSVSLADGAVAARWSERTIRHIPFRGSFSIFTPTHDHGIEATASLEDVRRYRLHLASSGARTPTINGTVATLRFFFNVTLDRGDLAKHLSFVHEPRKVPVVLSPEEVARFLEAAPSIKYKAALSVAYGAGLRVSEVVSLKISDVDSKRMMLRVEQGKGRKDRHAMLSPQLLKLLRDNPP